MTLIHRLASIVRWLLHRKREERQMHDELDVFIDLAASDKIRTGVPSVEARRAALLELGGLEQAKERIRTSRRGAWLDEIARDVRYAFRTFKNQPAVIVVVVLTLSLGIGANTAIFSLIDALMLRWLPVRDPQALVQLKLRTEEGLTPGDSFSYAIVRGLADQHDVFAGVAGFSGFSFNVGPPGSINKVYAATVTGQYFETLGLNPHIGRLLTPEDDEAGAPLVAVISYGYWERGFARNAAAVGQTFLINGVPVTIVGVGPPGFVGANVGKIADITTSVAAIAKLSPDSAPLLNPGNFWLRVIARPKEDLSIPQVRDHLAAVWPQLAEQVIASHWPAARRKAFAEGVFEFSPGGTGWTNLRPVYQQPLFVLMAVVALVLLLACANVASLLLARASARQREIAVRLAIGAGRTRIVRQLLTESILVSLIGAAFGIGLAWVSSRFLVNIISASPGQVTLDLTPNWHIMGFASAVAIATAVAFGLVPAFHSTAAGPSAVLREDARMSGSRSRLLSSLVSMQVALSLLLLVGAGLFVRTLQNLKDFDPGFRREGVLLVDLEGRRGPVTKELLDELQRLPGISAVSLATHTPLSGSAWSEPAVPKGQAIPERDNALFVGAGPRFFETMQIRLLSGRDFADHDSAGSPDVAVINEAFARRYFPNQNPVGQSLSAKVRGRTTNLEIIGLVKNTSARGLRLPPPPTVYVSYSQLTGDFPTTLEVRATGSLGQVATAIRQALQRKLPNSPVDVWPLSTQIEATMVRERMMATLAGGFAVLALVLVYVGLYGLLAYSVGQRIREMAIRMALGARRSTVIGMMLKSAVRPVLIGIAVGLPAAWAASHWVKSMLFGLQPNDPGTIVGAILMLLTTALLAAYLPARRASHVDPMATLRHD
jgi:predicted permease